ncbi:plasmid stabilization protein [Gandjariella thermophila]|uniref:Plasmid stabilization protein n=1 Tax=Gandjariella thermophila TaxID=1931992 RepID=A0A4D4J889_9PSEU|nr:plasmid stabilization protein [Gandjariella thermophila]GDY32871.1 hypothetical protein GTS_45040 [Gandjariella thermophila]
MPRQWSSKRERQYEHIKRSTKERGSSEGRAKQIAARTVNKNRAQSGESRRASKTSTKDVSPQYRGGKRSGTRAGPGGQTKQQLMEDARRRGIRGRSRMTKGELKDALGYR